MGLAELMAEAGGAEASGEETSLAPEAKAAPAEKAEDLGAVEEAEDGKSKHVPYSRFAEVNVKRKAEAERAAKLEAELKAEREKGGTVSKAYQELYGQFDNPLEQMREDAAFAQAVWQLRDDPVIKQALAKVQQHHQGAVKAVQQRDEKPAETAPVTDPRVDELLREGVRDKARSILSDAKVRDQLHGPILDYVLAQKDLKPTREAILTAMREYVGAQGWTNEFLRGSGQKPKPAIVPNPGGLNGGPSKKADGEKPAAPEKPKSLSQLETQRRSKFQDLMRQRAQ